VLATVHLTVAGDVTEERYLTPGSPDPSVVLLRQGGGFGPRSPGRHRAGRLRGACDGELAVGQIVRGLAAVLDVSVDDVAADVLPSVRGLVSDGLLLVGR